ncbi:hypothetical protein FM106_21635 [Brachybacterium faecium]|nr:hypothetical protein FM106_21635 [Brachybacterium faecium]
MFEKGIQTFVFLRLFYTKIEKYSQYVVFSRQFILKKG